jgi:hypothetical protein
VGATVAASIGFSQPLHAAVQPMAPDLRGPYLDLATPRGNKLTMARLNGDLDLSKQHYGWYSGYVVGVRPGEKLLDLFGFEGFGVSRLLVREDLSFAKVLREVGIYFDLESGEPLEEWTNPYTNETVRPVHVANDPFNSIIAETFPQPPQYGGLNAADRPPPRPFLLPWRMRAGKVQLERHIHLYYKNALQPDEWPRESAGEMAQVSEFFAYQIDPADLQNKKLTSLPSTGVWNRVTPWLPWMLMGQTPGHCQYQCYMGTAHDLEAALSRSTLDYVEKHYAKYFDAPTEWVEPSLSSIERYALEQKPAPARKP